MDQPPFSAFTFNAIDFQLISLVKLHPELYDPRNASFNKEEKRKISWEKIARTLGKDVFWCVLKWNCHCNFYKERKKFLHSLQNQIDKMWPFATDMNFLSGIPDEVASSSSLSRVAALPIIFESEELSSTHPMPIQIPSRGNGNGRISLREQALSSNMPQHVGAPQSSDNSAVGNPESQATSSVNADGASQLHSHAAPLNINATICSNEEACFHRNFFSLLHEMFHDLDPRMSLVLKMQFLEIITKTVVRFERNRTVNEDR